MDAVNENRGLLKKTSQLCREENKLIKQVNVLKDELLKHRGSLNELEQIKKTMQMMNFGIMALDHILMMGKTTKGHKGLSFMEENS